VTRRRRTLRTRLMLLYAGPFFVAGTVLLTVPLLGVNETSPANGEPAPEPGPMVQFPFVTWSLSLVALVLLSIGLGWLVAGRFLRPLHAMTANARDISTNNLHRRLGPTGRRDELAELAETLDELFARLEAAFVSQRHFVANASHELRTPLTAERALLQVALADPDPTIDTLRAACRELLTLSVAQERLIEALLTLASGEQGVERREPFDLAAIADAVLLSRQAEDVTVETSLEAAPASGDPRLVESLVANLVDNALRYNMPGGRVEVATGAVDAGVRIVVRNTGPVVPPAELDRLFEPFQQLHGRRIRHGEGHGLGLAIVRAIADAHAAAVVAHARPAGGLGIEVTFPGSAGGSVRSEGTEVRHAGGDHRRMRRRWWVVAGVVAVLLGAGAGTVAVTQPAVAATACPRCYGLSALGGGVYSDRDDPEYRRIVDEAGMRIAAFYGGRTTHPRVLICATAACYRRIGGGGEKGKALGTWALMLAPAGANQTIATHELSHLEFHERLGKARGTVPNWFDEGLAVLVSDDSRYLKPSSEADRCRLPYEQAVPIVDADWTTAVTGGTDQPYRQAACVVSRWVSAHGGPAAVLRLIATLRAGGTFATSVDTSG
jgi:signal transduction histidine kinase